jgi:hypothetical protein
MLLRPHSKPCCLCRGKLLDKHTYDVLLHREAALKGVCACVYLCVCLHVRRLRTQNAQTHINFAETHTGTQTHTHKGICTHSCIYAPFLHPSTAAALRTSVSSPSSSPDASRQRLPSHSPKFGLYKSTREALGGPIVNWSLWSEPVAEKDGTLQSSSSLVCLGSILC